MKPCLTRAFLTPSYEQFPQRLRGFSNFPFETCYHDGFGKIHGKHGKTDKCHVMCLSVIAIYAKPAMLELPGRGTAGPPGNLLRAMGDAEVPAQMHWRFVRFGAGLALLLPAAAILANVGRERFSPSRAVRGIQDYPPGATKWQANGGV